MGANAEVVRKLWEGFGKGDLHEAFADVAPDAEIVAPQTLPWGGRYQGPEGYEKLVGKVYENFEELHPEPQGFLEVEESQVLVPVKLSGRTKAGNELNGGEVLWLYEVREGRVQKARAFTDTALLLEALG